MEKLKVWVGVILMAGLIASATVWDELAHASDEIPEDTTGGYLIGPEDVLEIVVWKNAELSKVVTVRPDGRISLPLIGDVPAAGVTANVLRESIRKRLKEFQKVPAVSVIVQQVNSSNIYMLGEVARPGKYPLRSHITLLQALSMAGGFTQLASRNNILILRKQGDGEQEKIIRFGFMDFIIKEDARGNVLLKRGDTIIVP